MFEHFNWMGAVQTSPVMIVIILCSVVTTGFAIERAIYFWGRRSAPDDLPGKLSGKMRSAGAKEALWLCSAYRHPAGAVSAAVLQSAHMSAEAIEEKLQIALSEQRMALERNLGVIGTMGNTAPLIGLLGTVWGIMRAFHDMAQTGSAGPSVVAAGVAEALLTTAAGLMVAVPAVMLYNHFSRRISVMLTVAENQARALRLEVEEVRGQSHSASRAA